MKISEHISRMLLTGLLTAMILSVTGGQWQILQSVAWARMIFNYSRAESIQTALEQTFDGRHPCELCKLIQKAKESDRPQALQQNSTKDDPLFLERCTPDLPALPCFAWEGEGCRFHLSRSDPPLVPPPRRFSGCA
jgi:hypothetical protein